MAAPSINTKMKLDGEREYKAALAEIKSGLNVLKSELNLASEQFRDNADSVEALTKKNDILDRTILTQKEKIEQIEKALQSSASAYGEADERTNRWKTQLNNAQAELVKMERALKNNESALDDAKAAIEEAASPATKYKDALADVDETISGIDRSVAKFKSELSLVEEQFRGNEDRIEGYTRKNEALKKILDAQSQKVSELKQALQNASEAYGESSAEADAYAVKLNKAEAELIKTKRAFRENKQEMEEASEALKAQEEAANKATTVFGKLKKALADTKEQGGGVKTFFANVKEEFALSSEEVKGLGDVITSIAGKLGIDLPDGAKWAIDALNNVNAKAALAATGLAVFVAAIAKVEKALISMTKESAAYVDNILTMSQTTGQSAEQLQEFSYATELLDVSMDTLQGSLTKLTNNMQNAINGTGDAKSAFEQLGISLTNADGSMRSANDVFYDTIDALGEVQNATERDALSMDIFGRSAQDLNPLIIQGSDTLKDYAKEAHDVGYVLDNEALEALGAVDDGFQRLQKTQESVKNQMAAEFAPYLTKALEDIRELIQKVGKALVESGAVDAFGSILESSVALLEPLGSLISAVLPALTAALKPIAETVALIADTANVIVGLFTFNGDKIKTALGLNASSGQLSNMQRASGAYNGYRYSQSAGWITEGTYTDAELRSMYNSEVSAGTAQGTFEAWKNAGSWRRNASGTDWFPGGRTLLSEHGAETAILPQGTRILTAQETRQTGGDTYNITIDAHTVREFEDILRIVQERRRVVRMGGAAT